MSDFSGLLTTSISGSYFIRVTQIQHGLNIIATTGTAAKRKAFYPVVSTAADFTISIAFPDFEGRERFTNWMSDFMNKVTSGRGFRAAMKVEVPSHDFSRMAIPQGPLKYGDAVTDVRRDLDITFTAASDPTDLRLGTKHSGASYFQLPHRGGASQYFYPRGTQLSGAAALEGSLYDGALDGWEIGGGLANFEDSDPIPGATESGSENLFGEGN